MMFGSVGHVSCLTPYFVSVTAIQEDIAPAYEVIA